MAGGRLGAAATKDQLSWPTALCCLPSSSPLTAPSRSSQVARTWRSAAVQLSSCRFERLPGAAGHGQQSLRRRAARLQNHRAQEKGSIWTNKCFSSEVAIQSDYGRQLFSCSKLRLMESYHASLLYDTTHSSIKEMQFSLFVSQRV